MKSRLLFIVGSGVAFLALAGGGYTAWNCANPEYTCAQCHEINPTHERWKKSAHAEVSCVQCHGTAISNGIHSLQEKMGMVFSHVSKDVKNKDIRLTEAQRLDVADRCAACHRAEHAKWKSGAHSTTYANIFEDKTHNRAEKPYWECLRCHGMFYDGNINTLMTLDGSAAEWKIKDSAQTVLPVIPCLACHQIHAPKARPNAFKNCYESKTPSDLTPKTALYVRTERAYLRSDHLTPLIMYLNGEEIKNSKDPNHLLCQQCHSPDWRHEVRTSDDRTPAGAHEGFGCLSCHDAHSGEAAQSCVKCHDPKLDKYVFKGKDCPVFLGRKK